MRWTPALIWRRAREVLREEGLRSLWFKVLGETIYRRVLLLERILEDVETEENASTGRLSLLKAVGLPRYATFRPGSNLEALRHRLGRGESCFVMEVGGQIAHACWIAARRTRIDYLECEVDLPSDTCYAYNAYTYPALRGRGIAGARVRRMEPELIRMGYRRAMAVVGPENYRAIYFNTAAGYQIVGVMGYYQFGPWRRYFCKGKPGSESASLLAPRPC